jgi:hypothetical protein
MWNIIGFFNMSNTTGATGGARTAHPSEATEIIFSF